MHLSCKHTAYNWKLLAALPNVAGATTRHAQGEQMITGYPPTFTIASAKHALAFCVLRALTRLETGRRGDLMTDGLQSALILQFAPANTVTRSSSKLQGYWQAATGMAISAIFGAPKEELSDAFWTQSSAHRNCSQGTTQSNCRALQKSCRFWFPT